MMCVAPQSTIFLIVSTQRTGEAAWRTSASLILSGELSIATSTLLSTEIRGAEIATLPR